MIDRQITKKLEEFSIEDLAIDTEFIKRSSYKIDGLAFIVAFFKMLNSGSNTLESWAGQISRITGWMISVQSLQGKLQFRHVKFSEMLLSKVLSKQVMIDEQQKMSSKLLSTFKRVFVEDSTCVKLPKNLVDLFPGSVNQKGKARDTARIQCRMELKSGECDHVTLQSYRDNDQKFSSHILDSVEEKDLVLRDMGYWSLKVFRKIIKKGAFILSRFTYHTHVLDTKSGKKIELSKLLRNHRRKGLKVLDINVLVGEKEQLEMRLVAIKAPQKVEQQRKREMRKDKLERRSKDYLELLGWTIFVTNIAKKVLKPKELLEVYGFRWRIEIIFKCWKSKIGLTRLFDKQSMTPGRVYITFYLFLVWIILFFVKRYNFFLFNVFKQTGKIVSLFKFANYLAENMTRMFTEDDLEKEIRYLARYCSQTKRTKKSSVEKMYILNLA
jgi:hypothetical protein